jgi:hypothetical protein
MTLTQMWIYAIIDVLIIRVPCKLLREGECAVKTTEK